MKKDAAVDEYGGVSKGKREKKGFKVDRYERYQRMRIKKATGKEARGGTAGGKRVKAITFDEDARRDYLLTMHKRKNERRVKAVFDARQKMKRENSRARRAQREEARQAYNRFAAVPILPNFTYQLPRGEGDDVFEEKHADADCDVKRRQLLPVAESTVHVMPTSMLEEGGEAVTCRSRLDDEFVTVEVKPLFGMSRAAAAATGMNGFATTTLQHRQNDFSDLPAVVEQELSRLKKETKGPARTKPRLRIMKELAKIQKIKKYSRKGHGKKTAKGKKKKKTR